MFKTIAVKIISFYQILLSPAIITILGSNAGCRFEETCSRYTQRMIQEKGVLKGSALGFGRILKCQPLSS